MIEKYLAQVSSYAGNVDFLIYLIGGLVFFWFFVAEAIFFYFIFKFRAQPGRRAEYIDGSNPMHKRWITIPHYLVLACDVVIIFFAVRVWMDIKQSLPQPDETVRIIGQQWAWTFVHPGRDGKLDTPDDVRTVDELHVVQGKTYHFELMATDVLHSFSVPVFRLKQDAIPGRVIQGWFKADQPGVHDIQCAEMCGIGHGVMAARIFIESSSEHAAWLDAAEKAPAAYVANAARSVQPDADGR